MTTAEMTESTTQAPADTAPASSVRNQRLEIATALVSIPTFWLGVIAFAIGVSLYGF